MGPITPIQRPIGFSAQNNNPPVIHLAQVAYTVYPTPSHPTPAYLHPYPISTPTPSPPLPHLHPYPISTQPYPTPPLPHPTQPQPISTPTHLHPYPIPPNPSPSPPNPTQLHPLEPHSNPCDHVNCGEAGCVFTSGLAECRCVQNFRPPDEFLRCNLTHQLTVGPLSNQPGYVMLSRTPAFTNLIS